MTFPTPARVLGQYALFDAIASGGMASVHLGRPVGSSSSSRAVAIKRLHESFASDPEYVAMMLDEARLVRRIAHPNVVPTLDVVSEGGELWLVMEYVAGESLSTLLKRSRAEARPTPIPIVVDVIASALRGLHAAHVATSESGEPLDIVHRDVSPQNIMVGVDGISRVLDFGVAKAAGRMQHTRTGTIKGKVRYMAPEQVAGHVTPRADVYAASIVLWEALTGRRLYQGDNDVEIMFRVVESRVEPPSRLRADIPPALEAVVMRGLRKTPAERFPTAWAMADALRAACTPVTHAAVARWLADTAGPELARRQRRVAEIERETTTARPDAVPSPTTPAMPDADASSAPVVQVSTLSAFHPVSRILSAPTSRRARITSLVIAAGLALLVPLAVSRPVTVSPAAAPPPALENPPSATPIADLPEPAQPPASALAPTAPAAPAVAPAPSATTAPAAPTRVPRSPRPPSDRIYRRD